MDNNQPDFESILSERLILGSNLREKLHSLPNHCCAYCGSELTHISLEPDYSTELVMCFRIRCCACNQDDLPSISKAVLKSILMLTG